MKESDNLTPIPSAEYDLNINNTIPYYDRFHDETINLVKSMDIKPKAWLDTGCGTGTLVKKAIEQFKNTCFILADPSSGMLNQAKKKLSSYNNVKFLEPNPSHEIKLKIKPEIVTAILSHHYMGKEERLEAIDSIYNLLDENGIYIMFENISPFTKEGVKIGKKYWKDFQISNGKSHDEVEAHISRFNKEYYPITVEEHLSMLRNTGFITVELFWYSYMQAGFYCIK